MSLEYDIMLERHKGHVKSGYLWIKRYLPEVLVAGYDYDFCIEHHDESKRNPEEYNPTDAFLFGPEDVNKRENYRRAQLAHRHKNPHHWEFWILHTSSTPPMILDMEYPYIIEMICDWWAFSWEEGDLFAIFDWYAEHKHNIKLSKKTKRTVEDIMARMETRLVMVSGPRD